MAFARDRHTATPGQTDFVISFPYLAQSHVKVVVDGVAKDTPDDYTFFSESVVRFGVGLTGGEAVLIYRDTSGNARLVDYSVPGTLTESDLDTDSIQAFYRSQEAIDVANESMVRDDSNNWEGDNVRLVNIANPVGAQDVVTKDYGDANYGGAALIGAEAAKVAAEAAQAGAVVAKASAEAAAAGMKWRPSVRAATTANITLSGEQTIDGVALVAGDRVIVKDQTTAAQNGIYVCAAGGWPRASDASTWSELVSQVVAVEEGSTQADYTFICTVNQGGTLGVTDVTWSTFKIINPDGSIAFVKLAPSAIALQAEAEAGTATDKLMTAQRTAQAIAAQASFGLDLLATLTASNTVNLDFTAFNSTLYDDYIFELSHVIPGTADSQLLVRISIDGGANYDSGGSSYEYSINGLVNSTAAPVSNTAADRMGVTLSAPNNGVSVGGRGVNGSLHLYAPGDGGTITMLGQTGYQQNTGAIALCVTYGLYKGSTSPVNGIRFLMSSGNIATGTIRVYGVRK